MRRVIYAAATAFAAFALMTACDKAETDNGGNDNVENPGDGGNTGGGENENGSIATDVVGTYDGKLTITTEGSTDEPTEQDQSIAITMTENSENAVDLSVTDFSIGSMKIGTIALTNLQVTESDGIYTFATDAAQSITLGGSAAALIQSCVVEAEGSVTDGALTLSLDIVATLVQFTPDSDPTVMNVTVTFTGSKAAAE